MRKKAMPLKWKLEKIVLSNCFGDLQIMRIMRECGRR